jgi:hypothetical protein
MLKSVSTSPSSIPSPRCEHPRHEHKQPCNLLELMTPSEKILNLIRSFPCLERKLRDWHPKTFQPEPFYAMASGWSHGEQLCANFLLNVWNPGEAKEKGWTLDFIDFAGIADPDSRDALMRWLKDPCWP